MNTAQHLSNRLSPIKSFSWKILDKNIAVKKLDKTSFKGRMTGIPHAIVPFFNPDYSKHRDIILCTNSGQEFNSQINLSGRKDSRVYRMSWSSGFGKYLKTQVPHWQQIEDEKSLKHSLRVWLHFNNTDSPDFYNVSLEFNKEYLNRTKDQNSIEFIDSNDRVYLRKIRLEQERLKSLLFGENHIIRCGICGRKFPRELVWCAHIKKRSMCSEKERNDINVVMPMCKLGCDDLFENGYIVVNKGIIYLNNNTELTEDLKMTLRKIVGRSVSKIYFNRKSKEYFVWHVNFHDNKFIDD